MEPLILTGLALLPKIPAMWSSISGLFKKKLPKTESEAIELSKEISDLYKKGNLDPMLQIQLEKIIKDHQAQMSMIALEKEKLFYGELQGLRELEIAAYNSGDPLIAQTRPLMLRRLFNLAVAYCICAPILIIIIISLGKIYSLDISLIELFISLVKWIGGFIFSTFTSGYLGYSAARTIDKKNPDFKEKDTVMGKVVKNFLVNNTPS